MSDINVTPFVDVMLVLLIIFMVTAPMMIEGVEVSLPQTKAKSVKTSEDPLILTVTKEGGIFLVTVKIRGSSLRLFILVSKMVPSLLTVSTIVAFNSFLSG